MSRPLSELPDLERLDTLPKLLRHHADGHGGEIAMREKDLGLWRTISWTEYRDHVREIALGLRELGVGRDDTVALIGDNRPQWIFGEIAAHCLRAPSLGIYRDALDEEVEYLIGYAGCRVILAEDEAQIDKLLNLGDRIPSIEKIVFDDPRGMRKYDDPRLMPLSELRAMGAAVHESHPDAFDALVDAGEGTDVAILCTTSGTTSRPKLAMLQHRAVIRHVAEYLKVDPKGPEDEYVAVLPLPWIMEQIYAVTKCLVCRMKVNFVEDPETMMADMREIGPTFLLLAPRVWEAISADVRARIMDASPLKRRLFELGTYLGRRALDRGGRSRLADLLVYRPLRDRLGFTRLRSAATGGSALGPDTFRFFLAMGVPLRQLYGQTETMGAYTIHEPDDVDFDTVGLPFGEHVEVRVDRPDAEGVGEIVTRHDNMFLGYYRNEAETRAELRDGWMHTGDAGFFNAEGHLVVIDRVKDIATTARATRFSPQFIENKLKFSPYIAEVVVLGHGRDYLAAIVCIRYSIVSKWAEKKRIAFTTYTDLSSRPEVAGLIRAEVEQVNATMPEAQRIRKFVLLYKELDADDGELTRTRKVRRGVINDRYGEIIETIYSDAGAVDVDTTIAFQDGTTQRIRTTLEIVDLQAGAADAARAQAAE
jgi:long-chain acyl-CoA synthetase